MINGKRNQHDELMQLCLSNMKNWIKKWIFKCIYTNQDVCESKRIFIMFEQVKTLISTKQSTHIFLPLAEIVMHEERVERHLRGVQETLEQTDAEYSRLLNEFSKSINTYKDDIQSLEQIFLNATTTGALHALENRLKKQRNAYMEKIRTSMRNFRQRFDELIHYLRQANVKFRKSFK